MEQKETEFAQGMKKEISLIVLWDKWDKKKKTNKETKIKSKNKQKAKWMRVRGGRDACVAADE